ncbi:MAG TPA: type VI secretion system baseplate subunit TssF [Thermoanaerobaculia bacterium]|nr:type VI secretion system baseplate subunit TssF [Thermoanaerobaculia bacterium]
MTAAASEDFLRYYLEELTYLRHMGERFARSYPKVAGRLELQRDECPDPHVERLIESFAFLTARIQSDLDADFPEIAAELLGVLYPHYLNPVPSMAVARFDFDPDRGKLTTGYVIPRHTPLFSVAEQGQVCRFRTAYSVTLWPIEVTEAEMEPAEKFEFLGSSSDVAHVLRLRLQSRTDPFEVLGVDSLRFFLSGESILISRLFELLHESIRHVAVLPAGAKAPRYLGDDAIGMVGFEEEESVVPYPRQSHPAYRLLQEYFTFPEKFHFIDVRGLLGRASGQAVDLLFLLDRVPRRKLLLTPQTFALGCTPVANLFRKTSEPIRVDHRQIEYRLVPDMRKERTTEIHSVLSISGTSDPADPTRDYAPFYSFNHAMELRKQKAFWHSRRVPTQREDMTGTELMLSFRDLEFRPTRPPDEVVFGQLLCTNRALAEQLPADAVLQTDEALPVLRIIALKKPTRAVTPPLGGQDLWRLVSHLSLNYLSITSGPESLKALREILGLYCFSDAPSQRQQISGLQSMAYRPVVRRIGNDGWKGFCRGTEVAVAFDEAQYVGSSAFLLGAVLNRFFGLYASTNSFTQLVVRRIGREGDWKRWPPMAGGKIVL